MFIYLYVLDYLPKLASEALGRKTAPGGGP